MIYISGPMTGIENLNFPAFYDAETRLTDDGFKVLNPAREDEKMSELGFTDNWVWEDYLRRDLQLLLQCDTIYMLKGWEGSRGAQLEFHVADQLGYGVLYE